MVRQLIPSTQAIYLVFTYAARIALPTGQTRSYGNRCLPDSHIAQPHEIQTTIQLWLANHKVDQRRLLRRSNANGLRNLAPDLLRSASPASMLVAGVHLACNALVAPR